MDDRVETWLPWNVIVGWEVPIGATAVVNNVREIDIWRLIGRNRGEVSLVDVCQASCRINVAIGQLMFHAAIVIWIAARITKARDRELMDAHLKPGRIRRRIHVRAGGKTGRNRGVRSDGEVVRARIMPAIRTGPG